MTPRQLLVTAALPYANGHIHLGHLVEYIQTDIWVRFQNLRGNRCLYICADDTHGTAIMFRARQQGRTPEQLIAEMSDAHQTDFAGFDIRFDNYGSTHSDENRELCAEFWSRLTEAGMISTSDVEQLYDPQEELFLADRFVKGTCPNPQCGAADQYGDSCEKCGTHYAATDLIDPLSTLSGVRPEVARASHYFVNTEREHAFLQQWTTTEDHLHPDVAHWLKGSFLSEPLRDWDVSRPAPYFGFEIPGTDNKHYWYVWFDAPIGYIASTRQWCDAQGEDFDAWWRTGDAEIHHFIGKDITYFHTLFWPVMLKSAGFKLPTKVHVHGFLTVNGQKMSKSRGTFIRAATYLKHLDPAYLRYYYAAKLNPRLDDLDLNLEEFATKVNSDLVGKVVNLASRTARFVGTTGLSSVYPDDGGLFNAAAEAGAEIAAAYEACDYNRAMRQILALADRANPFVEHHEPWKLKKDPDQAQKLQDVCTVALNLFRQLAIYLAPVLPRLARQTGELLGETIQHWDQAQSPLVGTPVAKFKHMLQRVETKDVQAMVEDSREEAARDASATAAQDTNQDTNTPEGSAWDDTAEALEAEPLEAEINIDQFVAVDLRVARIVAAQDVPKAKKLLQITLSLGGDNRRNVFAGIKSVYNPDDLVGRLVICAANLAPRKMTFGVSEGMILAAGPGGDEIFLLSPDSGAKPGQRVH
jgi:methionyl-tRNA synthetase